jgi:hypothetical protein
VIRKPASIAVPFARRFDEIGGWAHANASRKVTGVNWRS